MPEQIYNIIRKAQSLRYKYVNFTATNAYRLVNSYGDDLPEITIDVYDKNLLVQYYKLYETHVKEEICSVLIEILQPESITEKIRLKGENVQTNLISGKEIPNDFVVIENGIKFSISFSEGGGTGLYLDQRDNRKKVQSVAAGKEVLNCFCYTTSFSMYANAGGAVKTVNVDLSKKAIEWGKKNFSLNQIDVNNHEFIVGDVWEWVRRFQKRERAFDLIIFDPPSFSTSKENTFTVEKDFPEIIGLGLNILRDNGILIFSTNMAKMSFSDFFRTLSKVNNFTRRKYKILDVSSQGLDFPTNCISSIEPYLKFVMLSC